MKKIIFLIITILIICLLLGYCFWLIYTPLNPAILQETIFSVQKGEGAKEIAINLKKENLIRSVLMFRLYVLFKGIAYQLKAGDYLLSPALNIPQIAQKFFEGDIFKEKITIVEGWNLEEIGIYLENKGIINKEEFQVWVAKDFSDQFSFLIDKPKNLNLEGYLFPDTYEINRNDSVETIIKKMLRNFDQKLTSQLREEIKKQNKSIFEVVTMASLVEKEGKTLEDKKIIAGILWKRLANNMPLQVDATIAYLLKIKNLDFEKMRKEIGRNRDIDSPYNTYKYRGLPLGPISNPGLDSLIATIYPEESDYWYYLSTADGQIIFSRTLEEHNLAKSKYY